ncbi:MAG: hypothetical protein LQ338_003810 [Usnochroma carphineum]|nr:MAG: hypothetical protein LQ338_003810 [Usnochroma carphineum]
MTSPRTLLTTAILQNSLPDLRTALDRFLQTPRGLDKAALEWALNLAVKRARPEVVRWLLEETEAEVGMVGVGSLGVGGREVGEGVEGKEVVGILEILVERGWDVNRADGRGATQDGQYLIYTICHSEPLLRWCLDHNARVAYPDADPDLNPPLTEVIATQGTLGGLKLVLAHGAPLGRRTLHLAVQSAAYAPPALRERKMEMVRFLVDELGVSVDAMDVAEGEQRPNHWGVPMAYAVPATQGEGDGGEEVVRFLLERGANPEIKDCWGLYDVRGLAERMKNEKVLGVLREWDEQRKTREA